MLRRCRLVEGGGNGERYSRNTHAWIDQFLRSNNRSMGHITNLRNSSLILRIAGVSDTHVS